MNEDQIATDATPETTVPQPLNARQRRILGALIEKARTTPDAYPLSLNALVNACNQKSNRSPLMSLTAEQVEDELIRMREGGVVAEVHGGGRVAKYRHYGHDYLGVKGTELGVLTELLLRGEQTAGDLRTRASRFEPIADLQTLHSILQSLIDRNFVVALTPPGRGQLFTHNLYMPNELEQVKANAHSTAGTSSRAARSSPTSVSTGREELNSLQQEISELRLLVEQLVDRVSRLEG